jgi:hypothetical protein
MRFCFVSSFFAVCKRKAIEKRLVRFKGLKNAFAFLFLRKAFKKSSGMGHLALCIICVISLTILIKQRSTAEKSSLQKLHQGGRKKVLNIFFS